MRKWGPGLVGFPGMSAPRLTLGGRVWVTGTSSSQHSPEVISEGGRRRGSWGWTLVPRSWAEGHQGGSRGETPLSLPLGPWPTILTSLCKVPLPPSLSFPTLSSPHPL